MELIFNEEDVKKILIDKAYSLGFEANTVTIEGSYSGIQSATVSFVKAAPIKTAVTAPPIQPPMNESEDDKAFL